MASGDTASGVAEGRLVNGRWAPGHSGGGNRLGVPNKTPHLRTLMMEHGLERALDEAGNPLVDKQGNPIAMWKDAMRRLWHDDPAAYVTALERFSKHGGSTGGSRPVVIVIPSSHPGAKMIDVEAVETVDPEVL